MTDKRRQGILDLCKKLKELYVAAASDALDQIQYLNCVLDPQIKPLFEENSVVCGPAYTLRGIPLQSRSDAPVLQETEELKYWEGIKPGVVLVMGTSMPEAGCTGDCMMSAAVVRKGAGIVIDGWIRDIARIKKMNIPVFAKYVTPKTAFGRHIWIDIDVPIQCGNVLVNPGDIVFGDPDGVVVIPEKHAEEVYERAKKVMDDEESIRQDILKGGRLIDIYRKHGYAP